MTLNIESVQFTREGAVLSYQGSKTNQYKRKEQKALFFSPDPDTCPVRALQDYMEVLSRHVGPLFVCIRKKEQITEDRFSYKQVARTTKAYLGEDYSTHSLRACFVTIAKLKGTDHAAGQTPQPPDERPHTRVQHNAAMKFGL